METITPDYYEVITEFCYYPKTEDMTLDFFNFLEEKYPIIWDKLKQFYSDDEYSDREPGRIDRIGLDGYDDVILPGRFAQFLPALKNIWTLLTDTNYGECDYCHKVDLLEIEHNIVASYDFAPVVKYYQAMDMNGAVQIEQNICRSCAIKMYHSLASKCNPEKVEFWI